MTRALLEDILVELRPAWTGPLDWDESPVSVTVEGDVAALPADDAVERAFAARSFVWAVSTEPFLRRHTGRRDLERLACHLVESGPDRYKLALELRTGRRPPVEGAHDWGGRRWPALFDEPCLYSQSRAGFIVEGRAPASGFVDVAARYAAWAAGAGLAPRVHETDRVSFGDADFLVIVDDRAPYVLLRVQRCLV